MNKIESSIVGALTQNKELKEWWRCAPVNIPLIGEDLHVTFIDFNPETDPKYLEEADAALSNFFELDGFHKLKIAPTIFSYFVDFASYLKEEDIPEKMKGTQPLSVWNFIYPTQVFISRRPTKDEDIYVVLACECEWNKIDGLQLVFRQGKKLTRVSEQDGHVTEADAYDVPDGEDKLLSEF